jgi:hypothetical protein
MYIGGGILGTLLLVLLIGLPRTQGMNHLPGAHTA